MDAKFKPKNPSKLPDAMQILRAAQILEINVGAPSNWVNSNTEILLNASL